MLDNLLLRKMRGLETLQCFYSFLKHFKLSEISKSWGHLHMCCVAKSRWDPCEQEGLYLPSLVHVGTIFPAPVLGAAISLPPYHWCCKAIVH